ncbi:MAG: hypothetical protein QM535_07440 [Limnohabitans sp.]|nr:hypothetical protein [Limnohabitans sp.]
MLNFLDYVLIEIKPFQKEPIIISLLERHLNEGYEFTRNNEWGIAFENLVNCLIDYNIPVTEKGLEFIKGIIELCQLDASLLNYLKTEK